MAEGRGGVVKKFLDHTTPSARTNEASRLFLIARPPSPPPAEEGSRLPQLSKRSGNLDSNAWLRRGVRFGLQWSWQHVLVHSPSKCFKGTAPAGPAARHSPCRRHSLRCPPRSVAR